MNVYIEPHDVIVNGEFVHTGQINCDFQVISGVSYLTILTDENKITHDVQITVGGKTYYKDGITTDKITDVTELYITIVSTNKETGEQETWTSDAYSVIYYSPLRLTLTTERLEDTPTTVKLNVSGSMSSLNEINKLSPLSIEYDGKTGTYTPTLTKDGEQYTFSVTISFNNVSEDIAPVFTVTAADLIKTITTSCVGLPGDVTVDFYHTGKGVRFGKVATRDGFEVDFDAFFNKPTEFNDEIICKKSLYIHNTKQSENFTVHKNEPEDETEDGWIDKVKKFAAIKFSNYSDGELAKIGMYNNTGLQRKVGANYYTILDTGNVKDNIDQNYNPESTLPQSGKAVAEAIAMGPEDSGWVKCSLTENFSGTLQIRKIGKIVYLRGEVTFATDLSCESGAQNIGMYDESYAPLSAVYFVHQDSNLNTLRVASYLQNLLVTSVGVITIMKQNTTFSSGATIQINA
ncbi:MAG: hypothetical protein IJZ16_02705, partial [Clostridia bacterium]|nr:hypothetical protein [Clostridia bacterium]